MRVTSLLVNLISDTLFMRPHFFGVESIFIRRIDFRHKKYASRAQKQGTPKMSLTWPYPYLSDFPLSYYKDSAFFIDNKGRTAINPNIFIYVLDGLIGLFTGWRSVFDLPKTCEKSLLAEIRTLHCSKTPPDACEKVLSRGFASLYCSVILPKRAFQVLSVTFTWRRGVIYNRKC